ncbi:MAG TPA: ComEC/Rec2 family competence protein [Pirellulales bacterium]|jgi:ComEC/Rec2-related protein|nr:ComEC/Rec2 family competence protein [Pirellulales bacterium]
MEAIQLTNVRSPAPHYQPLVLAVTAGSAGIVVDRYLPLPSPLWLAAGFSAWCLWFFSRRRSRPALGTALLSVALAAAAGAWQHQHWNLFERREIGRYAGELPQPVCVEVVALGSPRHVPAPPPDPLSAIPRKERSRFTAKVVALRDGDEWRSAAGVTQVWVDGLVSNVERGDRLRVVGLLSAPAGPQNPGEFDFARHCRADRQLSRLSADFAECLQVQTRPHGWSIAPLFDRVRRGGDELLWRYIGANRAALASALLLGVREELDDETNAAFAKTGTIHLLSISGLHVGILSMFLFGVLRLGFIGRRAALAGVALVTLAYALVIAAEPPAVRATIVVLFVCLAMSGRRRWQPSNLLAGAALVVLVMNPSDLFRIGPQLSFLAVAALTWAGFRFAPRTIGEPAGPAHRPDATLARQAGPPLGPAGWASDGHQLLRLGHQRAAGAVAVSSAFTRHAAADSAAGGADQRGADFRLLVTRAGLAGAAAGGGVRRGLRRLAVGHRFVRRFRGLLKLESRLGAGAAVLVAVRFLRGDWHVDHRPTALPAAALVRRLPGRLGLARLCAADRGPDRATATGVYVLVGRPRLRGVPPTTGWGTDPVRRGAAWIAGSRRPLGGQLPLAPRNHAA